MSFAAYTLTGVTNRHFVTRSFGTSDFERHFPEGQVPQSLTFTPFDTLGSVGRKPDALFLWGGFCVNCCLNGSVESLTFAMLAILIAQCGGPTAIGRDDEIAVRVNENPLTEDAISLK